MFIFRLLSIFSLIPYWSQFFILVGDRELLKFVEGCPFTALSKVHISDISRRINIKLLLSLFTGKLNMLKHNVVLLMD